MTRKLPALMALANLVSLSVFAAAPIDLRVNEGFENPLGFYASKPVFAWRFVADGSLTRQTAYRVVAASDPGRLPDQPDLWDSGKVEESESAWIPYGGAPLASRQRMWWRVCVWDQEGRASEWSEPAFVETGLLRNEDWQGSWIYLNPLDAEARAKAVKIVSARYGRVDAAEMEDVTEELCARQKQADAFFTVGVRVVDGLPGDEIEMKLEVLVERDGRREEIRVGQHQSLDLITGQIFSERREFTPQRLRKEFPLRAEIRAARLHLTAMGVVRAHLNGKRVDKSEFLPGWTPYGKKIETLSFDVTDLLREGHNALALDLGEGWFSGRLGWWESSAPAPQAMALAQLEVEHADGTREVIVTDSSWKASNRGPIRFSSIYDGETYDARMEMPGWTESGFDDSDWARASVMAVAPSPELRPKRQHPVQAVMELPSTALHVPEPGKFVFDLGQNIVGWPRLRIPVKPGQTVHLRFAEMLNDDGSLFNGNYRSAKCADEYTAGREGVVEWEPTFTFHGFRFIELSGFPEGIQPELSWASGVVLHSGFGWIGKFTSSHQLLNQLQSNIQWGLRGNFLEIPTDCPQRDERMGWTGDAQVFSPTAMSNADVHSFFASWLESMRSEQKPDGAIPSTIPNALHNRVAGAGWSDAATVVPWELYVRTGDRRVLEENYEMMAGWAEWCWQHAENFILDQRAYGDWLQPYPKHESAAGDTPKELIGTAYFGRSVEFTARAARVLGKTDEAEKWEKRHADIAVAFTAKFFDSAGKLRTPVETQSGYLFALGFGLLPPELRATAAENLARCVREEAGGHLRTGVLGTALVTRVLDATGYPDLAYQVLFQEAYPSWFFSIRQGATTMWERWNGYSHAEGFQGTSMNSFNHYAYGSIGQWLMERVAGLAPDPEAPGYRHFFIQPVPGGPLEHASGEILTPYGRARSAWKRDGDGWQLEAVVPPNTTATLRLQGRMRASRGAHELAVEHRDDLTLAELDPGTHVLTISASE